MPVARKASPSDSMRAIRHGDRSPVIDGRSVAAGTAVPRFGHDRWDLACIDQAATRSVIVLDFSDLAGLRKLNAKELIWQRLNEPVASMRSKMGSQPLSAQSCQKALSYLKRFYRFLDTVGIIYLHEVGPTHLDAFKDEVMRADGPADEPIAEHRGLHRANILRIADMLFESRYHLTGGGLAFAPWPDWGSTRLLVGYEQPDENTTPRIPEDVMGGLLSWALAYVDHFSSDIIALERACSIPAKVPRAKSSDGFSAASIAQYFDREVAGVGVPGRVHEGTLKPMRRLVAARAGVRFSWLGSPAGKEALASAISRHGLIERFLVPVFRPDGCDRTWRDPMSIYELQEECRHLATACYIVCAYLSGMRDGEVQTLRRDCLDLIRDKQGGVARIRVKGVTYKHRPEPCAVAWVVIDPVRRAIEVLRALAQPLFDAEGETSLFVNLHAGMKTNRLFKQINPMLASFVRHCNEDLAPSLPVGAQAGEFVLKPIPGHAGAPWLLTTRQFRRTIAWHIANRPFGIIAGAIQFKHAGIQMFEGYAGTSQSGFASELEQAIAGARRSDVVEMYKDSLRGLLPAGPMAAELKAIFSVLASEIGAFPGQIADNRRADALVRNKAAQLYPGELADCFYLPSQARCQKDIALADRKVPVTGLCDPRCSSACLTHKHRPNWIELKQHVKRLRGLNSVPPLQRDILAGSEATIDLHIRLIDEANNGQGKN